MMIIANILIHFWLSHPALLYGISFLLGLFCSFEASLWLFIPCLCLWLPFGIAFVKSIDSLKHLTLSLLTFFTAWCYAAAHYHFPVLPEEGIQGKAHINIHSISLQQSFFGERWVYRCQLKQFIPHDRSQAEVFSLPCTLSIPASASETKLRPTANSEYWVEGKLIQKDQGSYVLKVSNKASWSNIEGTWSLAEMRFLWKRVARRWIESRFSHQLSGSFLAGLATGEFDDSWMRQQFARFGLQHILAISGFHFAIIAGFLSFVLRIIPFPRIRMVVLLLCLGAYCLFLGPQASILRAWAMCSLTVVALLLDKQTTALNSLGLALLLILAYDPLMSRELGFQLSFATTAAILLYTRPAQSWLIALFPKRRLTEVIQMNSMNQHGYLILAFLRESLALSIAVNLFALPLTLFYFQQFPWMSLFYNLFFPLLTSASLFLLLLGVMFAFIPPIAAAIHALNDRYTDFLLQLTYQIPSQIDTYLLIGPSPVSLLIVTITLASLLGIVWKAKFSHTGQEAFPFI